MYKTTKKTFKEQKNHYKKSEKMNIIEHFLLYLPIYFNYSFKVLVSLLTFQDKSRENHLNTSIYIFHTIIDFLVLKILKNIICLVNKYLLILIMFVIF